jgi:hypothetical protein
MVWSRLLLVSMRLISNNAKNNFYGKRYSEIF